MKTESIVKIGGQYVTLEGYRRLSTFVCGCKCAGFLLLLASVTYLMLWGLD